MRVVLLMDNQTLVDEYYLAEPAFCAWIESGNTKLLFDTGYSELFLENARRLGLEISELDLLVLSHGHSDHTWGLPALARYLRLHRQRRDRVRLVAHPEVFCPKEMEGEIYGVNFDIHQFEDVFELNLSTSPIPLGDGLMFLGEIPRLTSFEGRDTIGMTCLGRAWEPDSVRDDSALTFMGREGLVVITGCSHSGIVNIVNQAMTLTGCDKVIDVVGGLHLQKPTPDQLEGTAVFLESLGLEALRATHCTDLVSKCRLLKTLPLKEIGSGSQMEYR